MADYTIGTHKTIANYAIGPIKIVKVDTNTYVAVWIRASDNYSICGTYSLSNGIWTLGTEAVPVFTGDAWYDVSNPITLCKIDTGRILFTYNDGASYPRTRLVDTTLSSIIDRGSLDVVGYAGSWACVAYLDTNKAVMAYKKTSDSKLYAVIVTVSGNIQSSGSPVLMANTNPGNISIKKCGTDKFAILFDDVTNSKITTVIGTVSGTVITPGTPENIPGETGGSYTDIVYADEDKYIMIYRAAAKGRACAATISGTIPTIGSVVEWSATSPNNIRGVLINTTNFMLVYENDSTSGKVVKSSVDWVTRIITPSTPYQWINNSIGGLSDRAVGFQFIEENLGACVYQDESDGSYGKLVSIQSNIVAPTNVNAVVGVLPGEINISWDPVDGATSYNIYWAENTGVTKITGTKIASISSPYTHTGRTFYQEYFYIVTAVQNGYESDESTEVSAFPYVINVNVTATPDDSANILTWDDVPVATKYDIYWSLTSGFNITDGTKIEDVESGYIHENLTKQIYYYIVIATIGVQEYPSDEVSAKPDFEGKIFDHNDQIKLSLLYQYTKD